MENSKSASAFPTKKRDRVQEAGEAEGVFCVNKECSTFAASSEELKEQYRRWHALDSYDRRVHGPALDIAVGGMARATLLAAT